MSLLKIAQWFYGKPKPKQVNFINEARNRKERRKKLKTKNHDNN
jgi:hypothetical protein